MLTKVAVIIGCGLLTSLIFVVAVSCFLVKRFHRKRRGSRISKRVQNGWRRIRSPGVNKQEIPTFSIPATVMPFLIQKHLEEDRRGSLSADDYHDGRHLLPPSRQSFTVGSTGMKKKLSRSERDTNRSKRTSKTPIKTPAKTPQPPSPVSTPTLHRKNGVYKKHQKYNFGKLVFSIYYDQSFHFLQIDVTRGIKISSPDLVSPPDSLVAVSLCLEKNQLWEQKTQTVQNSYDPNFNEKLEAHSIDPGKLHDSTLYLQLLDDRTCQIIGEVKYPMKDLPANTRVHQELPLVAVKVTDIDQDSLGSNEGESFSKLGQLLISVGRNPTDQKLSVKIKCARGLRPVSRDGTANPYVKLHVNFCGRKLYSRNTKTLQNTLTPTFNELNVFDLHSDKLPQTSLVFKVRHYGRMRDTDLGVVHLGYCANVESAYRHWEDVINIGNLEEIEMWHDLQEDRPASNTF